MTTELNVANDAVADSTGNVFADLGLPASEEDMLKVMIAQAITETVQKRHLTQAEAAEIVGMDQAKISAILRGRLNGYSIDRLLKIFRLLGHDVGFKFSRSHHGKEGRYKVAL